MHRGGQGMGRGWDRRWDRCSVPDPGSSSRPDRAARVAPAPVGPGGQGQAPGSTAPTPPTALMPGKSFLDSFQKGRILRTCPPRYTPLNPRSRRGSSGTGTSVPRLVVESLCSPPCSPIRADHCAGLRYGRNGDLAALPCRSRHFCSRATHRRRPRLTRRPPGTRSPVETAHPTPEEMSQTMADEFTTNDAGNPVPSDEHSLTVGPDGPILLHDHYLIEQMANFNRERIPGASAARQGWRRFRPLRSDQRRQPVHEGGGVPAGHQDRHADPVLDGGRRAGQPRHLARSPRIRAQALHVGGQPRHRREQRPDLLHPRSAEVPALHPSPRNAWPPTTFATTTCSGTSGRWYPSRRTCCPG